MKFFTICLVLLSSLIVEIGANNNSVPYEVLYFYYVYKMQYISGLPLTIAPGCTPSTGGRGSCFFDDFVKYIMEESFVQLYRPTGADHTRTPNFDNLGTFTAAIQQQSVSYKMESLLPELGAVTGEGGASAAARSEAALLTSVIDYANAALDSGRALATDAESAVNAAQGAMSGRLPQAQVDMNNWLDEELTANEQGYLEMPGGFVNWDTTLENVDNDVGLTPQQQAAFKQQLKAVAGRFGNAATGASVSARNHLSILRTFQDSVTQIQSAVNRVVEGDTLVPAPSEELSRCSSDYSSDSTGSELKKMKRDRVLDKYARLAEKQERALDKPLVGRSLTPISVSSPSAATPTTSTTSTTSTPLSTSPSSSSSTSVSTPTTPATSGPTSTGYDMAVTTVFTPPPECSGGITEVATMTGVLWQDIIDPVPNVTLTSCYPSQFVASALATMSLPPFSELVCPDTWESYDVNSTYVICCPNGFGLYAPNFTDTQRPGLNAICTSIIWPSVLMDVTSYDSTALATVLPETAGVNGTIVFASAFDGNTVAATATTSQPMSPSTVSATTTPSSITSTATLPAISSLPSCGQTCMNNMLAQYSALGCASPDPACLCRNVNFGYGITDCSNGACGSAVASTVIAFGSSYCSIATAAETTFPTTATPTVTGIAALPPCGQTCMNNMIGQYSTLGCASPQPACLCQNANFGYGIRDCANGACGTAVASTVISFGSSYCSSATAAA